MSDEQTEGVLGSLPRTRPHRRSAKRGPAAEPTPPAAPAVTVTSKAAAKSAPPAKTNADGKATAGAKPKAAKVTPAAKPGAAAPKAKAKAKAKATPTAKAKAKTSAGGAPTGRADVPVRSLQSATAPRAANERSRKPGVTSQAHHQGAPRPDRPPVTRRSAPPAAEPAGAVGTAVQAAAELTEIGLKASARALRGALSRLPRP